MISFTSTFMISFITINTNTFTLSFINIMYDIINHITVTSGAVGSRLTVIYMCKTTRLKLK